MTNRRNAAGWPVIVFGLGVTGLVMLWRDVAREGSLALGADTVWAAVEAVRVDLVTDRSEGGLAYSVDYRFLSANGVLPGSYTCRCREVEAMQGHDSIPVVVARRNAGIHRPATVPVRRLNSTLPLFGVSLLAAVAGAALALRHLRRAAAPPPPPPPGDGFTPLSVPRNYRR